MQKNLSNNVIIGNVNDVSRTENLTILLNNGILSSNIIQFLIKNNNLSLLKSDNV